MRSINVNTLRLQLHVGVDIRDDVIVYKQYMPTIKEIPTASSVKVTGDATSFFDVDDYVFLPLTEFNVERQISSLAYDSISDTTTIGLTGTANLGSEEIGTNLAKKYLVTDRLTANGISDVDQNIEGGNLFEFDSGELSIIFDNVDGYFYNRDNDGLFNNFDGIYWVKYRLYVIGSNDNWTMFFAGIVTDLTDTMPDPYNRTFRIKAYGHTNELNRYPAYHVIDTGHKDLPKIGGINITRYDASENSSPGIKKIVYKPFDNTRLNGVDIERVSPGTKSGIKILEFKYPHFFRWDNGAWVKIATVNDTINGEGTQQLFDKGGIEYVVINVGSSSGINEYPDANAEIWVNVKDRDTNDISKAIGNQGGPTITFDNGLPANIQIHFLAVITYDGSNYVEITDTTNVPAGIDYTSSNVLVSDGDDLYIFSDTRFWGIKFDIGDLFTASDIEYAYSTGGSAFIASTMNFANNGLVDNTIGFTSKDNPTVRWNKANSWTKNSITIGSITYKGYAIRIKRITATGNLNFKEVRRLIRAQGVDGDIIELDFNQKLLTRKDAEDELVIKIDKLGNYAYGGWYESIPIRSLIETSLDEAFYYPSSRILVDTKLSLPEKAFNIWGKPPRHNYEQMPSALAIDYPNQFVYIAVGLEIWRCYFDGRWERLTEIIPYTGGTYEYYISEMWIDNGIVYMDIQYVDERSMYISSMVYSYDVVNDTTALVNGSSIIAANIISGKKSIRHGSILTISGKYYRGIGQYYLTIFGGGAGGYFGENICIPYQQEIHAKLNTSSGGNDPIAIYDRPDLKTALIELITTGGNLNDPEWMFALPGAGWNDDKQGEFYIASAGYYCLQQGAPIASGQVGSPNTIPKLELKIEYGQQGCILRTTSGSLYAFKLQVDPSLANYYRMYDIVNNNFIDVEYVNESTLPISAVLDEANDIIYFGHTSWVDKGLMGTDPAGSYSYITKYAFNANRVINASNVFYWSGVGFSDITAEANNDNNLSSYPLSGAGDAIYIGMYRKRFRSLKFSVTGGIYAIQYWNGSAWVGTQNGTHSSIPNGVISFDIPNDWEMTSVNGSSALTYFVRIVLASGSGIVNTVGIREIVIFDSYEDTNGADADLMPTWLCLANNCLHGVFFNKAADTGQLPFQWQYFVHDLTSGITFTTVTAGQNYDYDTTCLFKNLVYASAEDCVYLITHNVRFKDKPSELLKATFNSGQITIDSLGVIDAKEWGAESNMATDANGHLFGITKDENYTLWEYTDEFYPRIEFAKFGESESIRNILQYITQMMNYYYIIHDDRKIRIASRGSTNGIVKLYFNINVASSKPAIGYWKHYYDAVSVKYSNPFSGDGGDKKIGFDGWMKKVLGINNPLIQNKHIAKIIADMQYAYYHKYRMAIGGLKLFPMFHIECMDKFNLTLNPRDVDLDSTIDFLITSVKMESDKSISINGIEI